MGQGGHDLKTGTKASRSVEMLDQIERNFEYIKVSKYLINVII